VAILEDVLNHNKEDGGANLGRDEPFDAMLLLND
jgi:hypothetical protein